MKFNFKMTTLRLLIIFIVSLSTCACRNVGSRVVGGEVAKAGQFPYSAAVYSQTSEGTFFCGGALIDRQWVLTAAHCLVGGILFTIRLGSNSLVATDSNRLTLATETYEIHPNFNANTLENNIGLIKFRMPIAYSSYVQPIELSSRDVPEYTHLTAVGWGQTSDADAGLSNDLRYVSLISISNTECRNVFGYQVSDDMICVNGNYNEGTCIGDTGGPLVEHIYSPQGVRHAGVASFVSGDGCESTHPSGYTRTFLYLDWIANVIANSK